MVDYPYRGLPVLSSHVAPLYAVWNAGPKLDADEIPQIAHHFCTFAGIAPPEQPGRVEEIKGRLELVAEIWEMITDVEDRAASWGKEIKNGKRKREDAGWDLRSAARFLSNIKTVYPHVSARLPSSL